MSSNIQARNIGFVNAEWKMQGVLKNKTDNKVNSAGQSYDGSLYTFKEMDYHNDWIDLKIEVKWTKLKPTVITL